MHGWIWNFTIKILMPLVLVTDGVIRRVGMSNVTVHQQTPHPEWGVLLLWSKWTVGHMCKLIGQDVWCCLKQKVWCNLEISLTSIDKLTHAIQFPSKAAVVLAFWSQSVILTLHLSGKCQNSRKYKKKSMSLVTELQNISLNSKISEQFLKSVMNTIF